MSLNSSPASARNPAPDGAPTLAAEVRASRGFRPSPLALILVSWVAIVIVLGLAIWTTGSLDNHNWTVEAFFLWRQDAPVLVFALAATLALALAPPSLLAQLSWPKDISPRRIVLALAAVTFVAGAAGVWLVFSGYAFSLDEFLANFDAQIFARGRLMAPIDPAWRPYASALQPMYLLPLPDHVWASSYLPVNAALRALGRLVHADGLVNPLLSAFSVVAVWGVGRRLWPERPDLALIAAALLGTSSQLIVMAMTAYAMPAHLAFNLAWLWLFLRGGKLGHAGAIAVGFFATGLHQLVFHPLFVAPFILRLLIHRRWGLSALYIVAYAAIGLFWLEYWPIATGLSGVSTDDTGSTGVDFFADRISDVMDAMGYDNIGAMGESLVRFATWQNLLLAPLALIGAVMTIWTRGPARALVLGVLMTLVVMGIATPTQTHGWGYRYLHGLLGSICLTAAWAWSRLTDPLPAPRRAAANGALGLACAVSLLVLTPVRAWQAWRFVHPYAEANAAIQAKAPADVVIVDHESAVLFDMGTLTRNDPFLERGPKVMALVDMNGAMVRELCATHYVWIFNGRSAIDYGLNLAPWHTPRGVAALRRLMADLNCGRPIVR
ncbi:MAG TPA: hypothetical protein VN814_02410 [Caulobacteraceae bacterium]|nr:hypothetical protein [Caulobacteraceae bacterium]